MIKVSVALAWFVAFASIIYVLLLIRRKRSERQARQAALNYEVERLKRIRKNEII